VTETFEVIVVAELEHRRKQWAQRIGKKLAKIVGGASFYEGMGLWKNGVLYEFEPHIRVKAYCNFLSANEVYRNLSLILKEYRESEEQECVLVILNGETKFLTI
jgi:hypothetical protein